MMSLRLSEAQMDLKLTDDKISISHNRCLSIVDLSKDQINHLSMKI